MNRIFSMKKNKTPFLLLILIIFPLLLFAQTDKKEIIYVGTSAGSESKGIYVLEFDRASGELKIIQTISGKLNPNFIAIGPQGRFLFSVNGQGLDQMPNWGSVTSYAINPKSGML